MTNAADPQQVKEQTRKANDKAKRRDGDLIDVLSTPGGRRFVWGLLTDCGLFRTSFTGNSTTFFNEGMRNVGLKVLGDIHRVCPERYLDMVRESEGPDDDRKQSRRSGKDSTEPGEQ